MTKFIELSGYQLWDFAGIDGLQFAQVLVGEIAGRIAPFQSLESSLYNRPCSVLRLCEGNFRLSLDNATKFEQVSAQLQLDYKVWVKRCVWMGAIALPEGIGLDLLTQIAIPKPPHRLQGLQRNCAAPTRIDGISILVWRHQLQGQPAFELHTAAKDVEAVRAKLV